MAAQLKTKYTEKQKAKAMAMLEANVTLTSASKQLNIPKTTLHDWQKEFTKVKVEFGTKSDTSEQEKKLEFIGLVDRYKAEFIDKSWDIIRTAETLIERRLKRAVESEDKLDEVISLIDGSDISDKAKTDLINKIRTAKVDDIVKLSTVLGTLYDKQALANKEATSIVDGNITVKKFEDF